MNPPRRCRGCRRPAGSSRSTSHCASRNGRFESNSARSHAIAKRFADGRAEFAAAEQLFPDRSNHYAYLAAKAIFEARARQNDQRDAFIAKAELGLIEPAPLWLALAIQSIRYRVDQKSRAGYARHWESELKKAVKSETAGEMAWLLDSLLKEGVEYPGRDTHVKKLVTYLGRSVKLSYRRLDLERVCEFLGHLPEKVILLEKLVKRGLKEHPQSARLHFEAGAIEFRKGMFGGSLAVARRHLEKAVELAGSSTERADVELLPEIKETLSVFNDLTGGPLGALFFGGLPFSIPSPRRRSRPKARSRRGVSHNPPIQTSCNSQCSSSTTTSRNQIGFLSPRKQAKSREVSPVREGVSDHERPQ